MSSPATSSARSTAQRPPRTTRPSRAKRLLAVTSLGLAGLLAGLLSGCSTGTTSATTTTSVNARATGNWQFSSFSTAAARLSSLGGSLTVSTASSGSQGSSISGLLHPLSTSGQCLGTSTTIAVTGSIDTAGHLTLSGPLSGGTLSLSGTLAADAKSLTSPTYTVTGGTCAFPAIETAAARRDPNPPITAQQYQPVTGTYTGTLTTSEGQTFTLTSTLTQTSQPDANGVYHVTGTAASPGNTCVPTSLPATASTIDGGSISTTYTDSTTGTSITATGNTSPDGTTITLANWTITSPCGSDTGAGTLTLH